MNREFLKIGDLTELTGTFNAIVGHWDDNGTAKTKTLMESDGVSSYIIANYFEYSFFDSGKTLAELWNGWLEKYQSNIDRLIEAYQVKYNPLWNVDGTETVTFVHGEKVSVTGEQKSESDTDEVRTVTKNDEKAYNSSGSFSPESQTESVTDPTHGEVTTGQRTDTEKTYTDTETRVRGGNIGVTKSTELLSDTVAFYIGEDLIREIFSRFADIYLYLMN